jgi:hypothetical protein
MLADYIKMLFHLTVNTTYVYYGAQYVNALRGDNINVHF